MAAQSGVAPISVFWQTIEPLNTRLFISLKKKESSVIAVCDLELWAHWVDITMFYVIGGPRELPSQTEIRPLLTARTVNG